MSALFSQANGTIISFIFTRYGGFNLIYEVWPSDMKALYLLFSALHQYFTTRGEKPDRLSTSGLSDHSGLRAQGLVSGVFRYVFNHTGKDQLLIMAVAVLAMPILYTALELPKRIINEAIDSEHFPVDTYGVALSQTEYLFSCVHYFYSCSR